MRICAPEVHAFAPHSGRTPPRPAAELNDETLRDGLQSPSVRHPSAPEKEEALVLLESLGVEAVSLGLPCAGPAQAKDVERLHRFVVSERLRIEPHCAGRTTVEDLEPIARVGQAVGRPIMAYAFLGTSPIRRYAEDWSFDALLRTMDAAFGFARDEGVPMAFVTEDTTRSRPDELERLFTHAIELGARRLVLCDTVGHATPEGAARLVRFTREIVRRLEADVALDWHGHDDRGLAVAASLAAQHAGVDRVHGTMLGVGERCGNAALDQLLRHQAEAGAREFDLEDLGRYRAWTERALEWTVPSNYPWPRFSPLRAAHR